MHYDLVCQTLVIAILLDALVGDPRRVYAHIPHPVVIIGHVVSWLDQRFNQPLARSRYSTFGFGAFACAVTICIAVSGAILIHLLAQQFSYGWIAEGIVASTLLAGRSLYDHVLAVAKALAIGLEPAREQISHIVGRDPDSLDEAAIARAAIESGAENFVDGFVAPVFWFAVFGMPGLVGYKAINTLDSMIAHRNERYEYFGKASAWIDDIANWIPARLGAMMLALSAGFVRGGAPLRAWSGAIRDAPKHRSMNAGWPEAAMANALGFALAGPRQYAGVLVQDAWMGTGRTSLNASDVRMSLRLYAAAWICVTLVLSALSYAIH